MIFSILLIIGLPESKNSNFEERGIKSKPTPTLTITSTPFPKFSYKTSVSYSGYSGAEYIETPTIDYKKLPTFDVKKLKQTVFKQKRVRVRITINKEGEVTEAKALNGHPLLQESSVKAAKNSLFSKRRRSTKTTLTYIFLLQTES